MFPLLSKKTYILWALYIYTKNTWRNGYYVYKEQRMVIIKWKNSPTDGSECIKILFGKLVDFGHCCNFMIFFPIPYIPNSLLFFKYNSIQLLFSILLAYIYRYNVVVYNILKTYNLYFPIHLLCNFVELIWYK